MKKIGVFIGGSIPSYFAHSFNVMKMADAFAGLGYEVEVVTASSLKIDRWKKEIKDLYSHYGVRQRMCVRWLFPSLLAYVTGRTSGDKTFCRRAAHYARENRFDMAYCRNFLIPYYTTKFGISTFIETHTTYYDQAALEKVYEVASLPAFKGLITIHENIKQEHARRGVPVDKILVLEDGIDIERFKLHDNRHVWRKELRLDPDKHYAVYCGNLYPEKGIEVILQSAKQLLNRKDLIFLLVGGTEKDKRFWKNYCDKQRIDNVQFVGFVENAIVPKYLKAADCLLLPYKSDMKFSIMDVKTTSPLKSFEYMATKRPIIATGIPTISKILEHRKNALLVADGDIDEFCERILESLDNHYLSQKLGERAYEDVQKYSWNRRCRIILERVQHNSCHLK